jgi:hypothetical protein
MSHTMPASDDFIDGVFNYCDRWCERCPLTTRCRLFAMERQLNEAGGDADNAAFWASLDVVTPDVWSDEFDETEPVEANEPWPAVRESQRDDRARHPLAKRGMDYGSEAHRWLRRHGEQVCAASPVEPCGIAPAEAFDVLNWYCLQIGVKLARALSKLDDVDADDVDADDVDADDGKWDTGSTWDDADEISEALEEADRTDRAGSAKVALIGIERSLGAWTVLRNALPEHAPAILDFLRQLGRLRRTVDEQIPEARTFRRPGFDDGSDGGDA